MSQEPVEIEHVEYMDAEPVQRPTAPHTVVYQSNGPPCCSGCGCLLACLALILFFDVSSFFGGALILLTALVLAGATLRLVGVRRMSLAWAYLIVPVFLVAINLSTYLWRKEWPYTPLQIVGATLLIYFFLYLAKPLGRR